MSKDWEEFRGDSIAYWNKKISKVIEEWCKEAGVVSPVGYYRNSLSGYFEVYTDRPGYLVGKGGGLVKKYEQALNELFCSDLKIKFFEIRGGFANLGEMVE